MLFTHKIASKQSKQFENKKKYITTFHARKRKNFEIIAVQQKVKEKHLILINLLLGVKQNQQSY